MSNEIERVAAIEKTIAVFQAELDEQIEKDNSLPADEALSQLIRPYLWSLLREPYRLTYPDARFCEYEVCCSFFEATEDATVIHGYTEGAAISEHGEIESAVFERVYGLKNIAKLLAKYSKELDAPFKLDNLTRRVSNLRPTLSRRGAATMRVTSNDAWRLIAVVRRG